MQEWLKGIIGDTMNPVAAYIIIFLVIVLLIYIFVRIARKLLGGTFVAGGKSRHLRLAIMDATPVDSRRRLVLVRRDDVEHLLLIGGPTDILVEQNIRIANETTARQAPATNQNAAPVAQAAEPIVAPSPMRQAPSATPPAPPPLPRPVSPPPVTATRPMLQPAAAPPPVRPVQPMSTLGSARPAAPLNTSIERPPVAPIAPAPKIDATVAPVTTGATIATAVTSAPMPVGPRPENASTVLTDTVFSDLSMDIEKAANVEADEISLEDEMEGLLANLDTKNDRIG